MCYTNDLLLLLLYRQESVEWREFIPHLIEVLCRVEPSLALLSSMPSKADIAQAPHWKLHDFLARYKSSELKHWIELVRKELLTRFACACLQSISSEAW